MSTYDENGSTDRSGRHPLSTGYLVAGLVFLGIAGTWALRAADVIDDDGSRWVLPVVLIVAGLAGLAASVVRSVQARQDPTPSEDAWDPRDEPELGDRGSVH
jgi:hypothetical protein